MEPIHMYAGRVPVAHAMRLMGPTTIEEGMTGSSTLGMAEQVVCLVVARRVWEPYFPVLSDGCSLPSLGRRAVRTGRNIIEMLGCRRPR
jgi:hypothetical protein